MGINVDMSSLVLFEGSPPPKNRYIYNPLARSPASPRKRHHLPKVLDASANAY